MPLDFTTQWFANFPQKRNQTKRRSKRPTFRFGDNLIDSPSLGLVVLQRLR
jgi:hypothetical protein